MLAQEIIQLSRVPEKNFRSLVQQALNHALWHYVLFYEEVDTLEKNLLCLLNEFLSKLLFRFFCLQNELPIEFKSQNGDRFLSFTLDGKNWELINLSVEGSPIKKATEAISLPAMIPSHKFDCGQKDDFGNSLLQWAESTDKQVVFTYLHNNSADERFLKLSLPTGLEQVYENILKRKKRGKSVNESDFWKKLKPLGIPDFTINHKPFFYITGWAGSEHLKFFYNSRAKAFPNIQTVASENKTILVHRLPAFSGQFPQLNEALHFAEFLR